MAVRIPRSRIEVWEGALKECSADKSNGAFDVAEFENEFATAAIINNNEQWSVKTGAASTGCHLVWRHLKCDV